MLSALQSIFLQILVGAPCLELLAGERGTGVEQVAAVGGVAVDADGGGVPSGSAAADELAFADELASACATGGRFLTPGAKLFSAKLSGCQIVHPTLFFGLKSFFCGQPKKLLQS